MSNKNAYIFCGADIVVPPNVSQNDILEGISPEIAAACFGAEFFNVNLVLPLRCGGETSHVLPCYSIPEHAVPADWLRVALRPLLGILTEFEPAAAAALLRACHIMQWRENSRYCGRCGSLNSDAAGETARVCTRCGHIEYPRISPAVITAVINSRDEILLAHNKNFQNNIYSLIAGFTEAGETLEQAVVREIHEEVNISVKNIHYLASQSWPFPNSLMIGFKADYAEGAICCDGHEILDACFFNRGNLPELPAPGSISRYIINRYKERKL
ncbi:MAG: NAD(+) diphosphatase [Spirochaetaceae bacterium]|jgi:NAD+ diphosphatase|nr:NAD(+) diphosphatase [Spirochaetaceae bacterium]